jgi:Glycosyltransferase family 87
VRREGITRGAALALAGVLAVEFALLAAWQRNGYWDFSDGVYAETARVLLHGRSLYGDTAAAQPPPVYLFGALLLAIHDGLGSLRAGLALVELVTAALVALSVWRLCGRGRVALAAGVLAPLLPITLHEHAQLLPETLAAPLMMGGALWCARREQAYAGGALVALAAACKLAFVLPALAVVLAAAARRRALVGFALAGVALALASLAVFGAAMWREAVRAQLQVGSASVDYVAQLLAQAAWNELPLVAGAAAALLLAHEARDRELLRTLAAAAGAGLLLGLTLFKSGSYVNVFVVAEPPLLALAACGAVWAWESGRARWLVALLGALLAAQMLSLLIAPGDPVLARRPLARSGLEYGLSPAAVTRAVAVARRCPPGVAYSGQPYLAFVSRRAMPGDQPDLFIIAHARLDAPFARRAAADQPRCPG